MNFYPFMDRVFPHTRRMAKRSPLLVTKETGSSNTARVLAENVNAVMKVNSDVSSNPKLAEKAKLGTGPIARVRAGENITLATLESVAKAMNLEPWQLLVPGFQPGNPPVLGVAGKREEELYRRIRSAAKEIAKIEQDTTKQ